MTTLKDQSENYWREKLTPEQYHVLREGGTEAPWSGVYTNSDEAGEYHCAACGQKLFSSSTKFESTSLGLQGWPAFYDVAAQGTVELKDDRSFGMHRIEVTCSNCGSHLGHLFDDGPKDKGGQHYCVSSAALAFTPKTDSVAKE